MFLNGALRGDLKLSVSPGLLLNLKGFYTFHTEFYDKNKCSEKLFKCPNQFNNMIVNGQYMTKQYFVNSGWHSVHYKK